MSSQDPATLAARPSHAVGGGTPAGHQDGTLRPRRRGAVRQRVASSGIVYALVVLVVLLSVAAQVGGQEPYLRPVNVANILQQSAPYAILAVFETIVLITRNFDISVGSVAALSALSVVLLSGAIGLGPAIAVGLAAGTLIGAVNGLLVQKVGVNSFIVTLGMLTGIRGLVYVITDGQSQSAGPEAADQLATLYYTVLPTPDLVLMLGLVLLAVAVLRARSLRSGDHPVAPGAAVRRPGVLVPGACGLLALAASAVVDYSLPLLPPVWLLLVLAVGAWLFLRQTTVGRRVYAVGGNAEAARLSGIRVDRYKIGAFIALGTAAGLVGAVYATQLGAVNPTGLQGAEFTVLTAAILGGTGLYGGTGNVLKSVVGALFLFTLINGFNAIDLGANWQSLVEGVVIIVAVSIYSLASRRAPA